VIGFGGFSGNILLSMAEGASTETNHRPHSCRVLEKAPAIHGLDGNSIL
jgi:hypothetical protein